VQGAFVSDAEIAKIIAHCAAHAKQKFEQGVAAEMDNAEGGSPNADNGGRIGTKGMSDAAGIHILALIGRHTDKQICRTRSCIFQYLDTGRRALYGHDILSSVKACQT
jgi:hypothetical protein